MNSLLAALLFIAIPASWLGLIYYFETEHRASTIEAAIGATFCVGLGWVLLVLVLGAAAR